MAKEDKKQEKQQSKRMQVRRPQRMSSPFDEMDRMFGDFFPGRWMRPFRMNWPNWEEMSAPFEGRVPKVDIIDRDEEVIVRAELPGVDKDDLEVSLSENSVTIKGESRHESKQEEENYYRTEISRGSFCRTIALPSAVDGDKAKADFNNGVLELKLPKVIESKRRSIKIN